MREKADAAFRQATVKVIERARLHGNRIIVCEAGQIVARTAEQMEKALRKQGTPGRGD
jgi:hypothetical protein